VHARAFRPYRNRTLKYRLATLLLLASAGFFAAAEAQDALPPGSAAVAAVPEADAPPTASAPVTPPAAAPEPVAPQPAAAPASQQASLGPTGSTIDASTAIRPEDSDSIAATVNDESISDYELRQRISLFVATSGLHPTAEDMKRIRSQTLDKLEDEKIQLQEAVKQHITVSPVEVDKAVNSLLQQNKLTIEQLRNILINAGSSELALRSQITAQLAWQKTVQDKYSDLVNISPAQVEATVRLFSEGANRAHFLVNEIFLPVTSPDQDAKVLQDAQGMENQLKSGAQFGALAHQYSQNPAAAAGGSIGWVHEGQLSVELNNALVKMKPGEISPPVRAAGGYYLLQLAQRQEPMGTKIEAPTTAPTNADGSLPLARLLLPLGPNPTQELLKSGMEAGNQIRQTYTGCDQLKTIADRMTGSVYMDLGNMKPTDLSPEIQKALAETKPGEASPPILSEAGIEIIGRCDERTIVRTAFTPPTPQQVQELLFDEQISALAQRYMRDLKRDADVEVR
jgi:peptidyl-prolyl cis-trans isomerase SurA